MAIPVPHLPPQWLWVVVQVVLAVQALLRDLPAPLVVQVAVQLVRQVELQHQDKAMLVDTVEVEPGLLEIRSQQGKELVV